MTTQKQRGGRPPLPEPKIIHVESDIPINREGLAEDLAEFFFSVWKEEYERKKDCSKTK